MSHYKRAVAVRIRCCEMMKKWGYRNVCSFMLSTGSETLNGLEMTPERFKEQWKQYANRVLKPACSEYVRFFEVQPRTGRLHLHGLCKREGMADGSIYAFDGDKMTWVEKGPVHREMIKLIDRSREFGFGWNTAEPLRNLEDRDADALAGYLVKYLTKKNYKDSETSWRMPGCMPSLRHALKLPSSRKR